MTTTSEPIVAAPTDSDRIACLTSGMARGVMLSSRTPRPIRRAAAAGSDAISPQTATRARAVAALLTSETSLSTAGSSGSASPATLATSQSVLL